MDFPDVRPSLKLPRISRLTLRDFRSYAALDLALDSRCVVFVGENGAGKTNLLEAFSLFSPGRGLRRAQLDAMARQGGPGGFVVAVELEEGEEKRRLGIGLDADPEQGAQRRLRIDGATAPSAQAFSDYVRLIWLIPAMDGLFTGPPRERRRFLDRLVLTLDPAHGARVNQFERALRGRNKLLEDGVWRQAWLDAIEHEAAALGAAIAAARAEAVARLSAIVALSREEASPFAWPEMAIEGELEAALGALSALQAEDFYRETLAANRARDAAAGLALIGPHAADFAVRHGPKNVAAAQCSTGEQKALLVSLVLANAQLVGEMSGMAPVVLLDELAAHFDPMRRRALFDRLLSLGSQVFVTGADPATFADLGGRASLYDVARGGVEKAG